MLKLWKSIALIVKESCKCYLPNNLDGLKNNSYPCIGLRLQDTSVEANFGRKKFKLIE
ncbi:hypothetical protein C2G38_2236721 [Gigaspora rosea]|uniref:Uncharacterized protein n=1 Tax=Gigaspora rosea TaxID=44941 RepID=A0A397TPK4_9GLOM|nr:hypothetical protein C2G38_2236721 [Gigaspora rosea]